MKLIVGLGNPGKKYEKTRHNVGFIVLDNYLKGQKWKTNKDSMQVDMTINGEKVIFLKPLTFMNLSGNAVARIMHFYDIEDKDLLVIHDDLDLPKMTFRIKYNSSSGGHNGIKSIIENIGSMNFGRIKIGIDNKDSGDTKDYVLDTLSKKEIEFLKQDIFSEIIDYYLKNGIEMSMNKYNNYGEK